MSTQYIYLLKEREFIKTCENIYKIGKTTQINDKRFRQYPKGSMLLFQSICSDCSDIQKNIMDTFSNKFKQRKDIGSEYFEGNCNNMIIELADIIKSDCDKSTYFIGKIEKGTKYVEELSKELVEYVVSILKSEYDFFTKEEYSKMPKLDKCKYRINRTEIYNFWSYNNPKIELNKKQLYKILSDNFTVIKTNSIQNAVLAKKKSS